VAVRYLRRSTDRREPFIPDQEKAIERYAVEHGLELARLFVDDGASCGRRGSCRLDAGQESASTQHPCPHGQAC
jgi:DNA invertase Pin-like site-specific DNA recombinase